MTSEEKTFRVVCAECGDKFIVRFPLVDEAAEGEGEGEEVVTCMFCKKQVKIPLEKKYMQPGELIRSRKVDS